MVPDFLPTYTLITFTGFLSSFFICNEALIDTGGNIFEVVNRIVTFSGCTGLEAWMQFGIFIMLVLPWLFIVAEILYSNVVTGTVTTIAGAIAILVGFFT